MPKANTYQTLLIEFLSKNEKPSTVLGGPDSPKANLKNKNNSQSINTQKITTNNHVNNSQRNNSVGGDMDIDETDPEMLKAIAMSLGQDTSENHSRNMSIEEQQMAKAIEESQKLSKQSNKQKNTN
eukprot:UN31752